MKPPPIMEKKNLTSFPGGNPFILLKLRIGQPNDKYEQEADRVADQVISMPGPKQSSVNGHSSLENRVQRQTDQCPECNEKEEDEEIQTKPIAEQITPLVQRQAESEEEPEEEDKKEDEEDKIDSLQPKASPGKTPTVTRSLQGQVNSLKGGGLPLPESARNYFEPRFGTDFSQVRVHTDNRAAETAGLVNARAYTLKNDMVFGPGQYSPGTTSGNRLLAHELTHVIQQRGSEPGPGIQRKGTFGGFWSNVGRTFVKLITFGAVDINYSRDTLLNYLELLKNTFENDFDSDLKARNVVRLWKAKDPDFELTAAQKVNLIKEMLEGWTSVWDENAILDLLKGSSDADLERILGKGGISYKKIKDNFSLGNLKELEAFRKRRISSTDKDIEEGTVKVRPKYITTSFRRKVNFHTKDPDKGWVVEKLKRGRRVELLDHPEEDKEKSAGDASTKSTYPKENYYYVRITIGRHRDKVGYIKKSDMFIPTKTSLLEDSKKDTKKFRPVSLVFFQNTERIQKRMEDIGAALTTQRTHLWEKDPGSPSTLKQKKTKERTVTIGKDRKVIIYKKETFNFKKSEKADETSSFYYVKAYIGSEGIFGYVDKSHLKSDIRKREGERDYFINVAKTYTNRGGLRSIYVDPYSQKCEDRQYPIEYYAGSEIKQGIIGAKNCTNSLVTRIHIVAHGGPNVIAGYGDVWDSYGLYLKSTAKKYISRNKEMRGLTTAEFSRSLKNYLDKDVSIWLHACSTAKKHEVKDIKVGTKKVKGFAEELAQELRVYLPKATVRGFKTKGAAGRDPKGMVRYPK